MSAQGGLFGSAVGAATNHLGIGHNPASNQGQHLGQMNQAAYQSQLQQMHAYNQARQMQAPQWVFNGRAMSFEDFVDAVWPEDTPEKTMFVLKYTK